MSGTSRTLDLLLLLAVVALVVTAASQQWLQKLTTPIGQLSGDPTPLPSIGQAIICTLAGIPLLGGAFKGACGSAGGSSSSSTSSSSSSSSSSGSSSSGTSLFNVPIEGPNGTGAGTIQVVANGPAAAEQNATQGGNTPTGPAVSA